MPRSSMPKEGEEQDQAQVLWQLNSQVIVPSPDLAYPLSCLTQSDQIKRQKEQVVPFPTKV